MKRRDFITGLGGAAMWPSVASAQRLNGMRRIGVLAGLAENDPEIQSRLAAFRRGLERRGWSENRNVHIDIQDRRDHLARRSFHQNSRMGGWGVTRP